MSTTPSSARWPTLAALLVVALVTITGYFSGKSARRLATEKTDPSGKLAPANQPAPSPASTSSGASADWESRWRRTSAEQNGPLRSRALAALLEELARTEPQRALDLAMAEANWHAREELRHAALRGWGATAPDAAADWALTHRLDLRMQCMEAVLTGAAENPAEAVRVALRVCAADPEPASDYGHTLISALIEKSGAFEAAADFAAKAGTRHQNFLADSAFYQWAQHRPQAALAGIGKIADPKIREASLDGLFQGWADADAKELATFAQTLPTADERGRAWNKALPHWVTKDPAAATEWIGKLDPSPELDAGIIAVAELPALNRKPETALEWASNITDSAKRIMTKNAIFRQWAERDLGDAERFAQSVKNANEREMMLEVLSDIKSGG